VFGVDNTNKRVKGGNFVTDNKQLGLNCIIKMEPQLKQDDFLMENNKKCIRCGKLIDNSTQLCLDCIVEIESKTKEMQIEM
jgi:hypothetical protein